MWAFFQSLTQRARAWVGRHRTKLIVAGVCVGLGLYAWRQWRSTAARFEQFEQQMMRIARMESYYDQNQRACLASVAATLPLLHAQLFRQAEVPSTAQMRSAMASGSQADKLAMWERVKTNTFVRATSALYAVSLLYTFQRLQLNVLGRHLYLLSAHKLDSPPASDDGRGLPAGEQQRYLATYQHLLQHGLPALVRRVESLTAPALAAVQLQRPTPAADVLQLLAALGAEAAAALTDAAEFLLPPAEQLAAGAGPGLAQLLAETQVLLRSPEFRQTHAASLALLVRLFSQNLGAALHAASPPEAPALPLVKLLPVVSKQTSALLPDDPAALEAAGSDYLRALAAAPEQDDFARRAFGLFDSAENSNR